MTRRTRVVITGLGAVTNIGTSVDTFWENLVHGHSGVRRITQFDARHLPCQIAGEIQSFSPEEYMDRKDARRIPRSAQIALAAAQQAVKDARLPTPMRDPERAGVCFGTGIGGLEKFDEGLSILRRQGYSKINPFILPASIPNLSAFLIAREFQCLGPNATLTTACATGTQAIGEAAEFIRRGSANLVIAGGTEALIKDYSVAGFISMRVLPVNYNDRPEAASRPFELNREGFIFSEGAGALVLESLEHALERKARIYAEVAGHASSTDGFHIAAPDPQGNGPARAMKWAISDAGLEPQQINYINAHGTGTQLNDLTETIAIKKVFGDHAYKLKVSSTKSMIGHAMGASGALEAIICTLVICEGTIPPTINYDTPDPECDLNYVPNESINQRVIYALSNSLGLGGQNACLIIKKFEQQECEEPQ